ncbi:hypothetical protein N1851_021771 [Merluccius polli]|uniref:Uncharacterized protein n=1 Tax=Merluccius polli TaxID=89951 RepID=A0AA47NWG7_MERPO|nr:hypothetical protein N1851_021771 [Merluccius polli]
MYVAVKRMQIMKMGCFAHTLNVAAQKLYIVKTVASWSGRIRAIVVWLRKASLAKPVLKEKQRLLGGFTFTDKCFFKVRKILDIQQIFTLRIIAIRHGELKL